MKTKRINKWLKEYVVQGYYGAGYGWEDVAASDSYREAREDLKAYRENDPHPHRLITRRVRNEAYAEAVK